MKKTLIAFFVLSVLVAACPVFAVDNSKAPTGFRGIKWDTPVTSYPNTFERAQGISRSRGQVAYEKIDEKRSFAGHRIDRVLYYFDSVGFVKASVRVFVAIERGMGLSIAHAKAFPIYNDFIKACSLQWGKGVEHLGYEVKDYSWYFPSSTAVVNFSIYANGDAVTLDVYSGAGEYRAFEYEEERMSSESESDF